MLFLLRADSLLVLRLIVLSLTLLPNLLSLIPEVSSAGDTDDYISSKWFVHRLDEEADSGDSANVDNDIFSVPQSLKTSSFGLDSSRERASEEVVAITRPSYSNKIVNLVATTPKPGTTKSMRTGSTRSSVLGLSSTPAVSDPVPSSPEERLYRFLFNRGYLKSVRPALDPNKPVVVKLGMCVMMIEDLIERDQMMIMAACVKMIWEDYRLRWDPNKFQNITWMTVSTLQVWFPDIVIVNSPDPAALTRKITSVGLDYRGEIGYYPSGRLFTRCNLEITYFPFDWQQCEVRFESWISPIQYLELDLYPGDDTIDLKEHYINHQWTIKGHRNLIETVFYDGQNFSSITITFVFRRKAMYFSLYFIFPEVLLAVLQTLSHSLPVEHPGRMTMLTALFIGTTVTHSGVASHTPKSSDTMSLLQVYMTVMSINLVFSLLVTFLMLYTVLRYPSVEPSFRAMMDAFFVVIWPTPGDSDSPPLASFRSRNSTRNDATTDSDEFQPASTKNNKEWVRYLGEFPPGAGDSASTNLKMGNKLKSTAIEPIANVRRAISSVEKRFFIPQNWTRPNYDSNANNNGSSGADGSQIAQQLEPRDDEEAAERLDGLQPLAAVSGASHLLLATKAAAESPSSSYYRAALLANASVDDRSNADDSPVSTSSKRMLGEDDLPSMLRQRRESQQCRSYYTERSVMTKPKSHNKNKYDRRRSLVIADANAQDLKRNWLVYCVALDKSIMYATGTFNLVAPLILFGVVPLLNEFFLMQHDDYIPYEG